MKRIPSLDGFRAISILLVLIAHSRLSSGFPAQFIDLAKHGDVGVTIFFVISGFLITYLLFVEESKNGEVSIKSFYIRRAFRILPVFVAYTLFILLFFNFFEPIKVTGESLIYAFTFTMNFEKDKSWFIGHFWSLSVEEQFYLFWPILVFFFKKQLRWILYSLICYSCVARIIAYKYPAYNILSLAPFFSYSDSILIGACGGIYFFENNNQKVKRILQKPILQLLSVFLIALFVYLSGHGKLALISLPFGNTIISISVLFLLLAYATPSENLIYKSLNSKLMVHIGVLSYSVYIWQQFFFVGHLKFVWRNFPYNLVVIYLVSACSYYLLEKPFLNLRKKITNA